MATYITKKCPKCGNFLEHHREDRTMMGEPFIYCSKCGNYLIDNEYKEYIMFETTDYISFYTPFVCFGLFMWVPIVPIVVITAGTDNIENYTGIFIICAILSILFNIYRGYKRFESEKSQSIERLKNDKYLKTLLDCGLISKKQYSDFKKQYNVK